MRLYADHYLSRVASLTSPGIDEIRSPAPLRPGDTVRIRTTIAEARRSVPSPTAAWCTPGANCSTRMTSPC